MNFSEDRGMSRNTMLGIGIVILLHIMLVYALVSGLATSAIDVIRKPLEIKIIQAAPPAPPSPPALQPPPPPVLTTPPPPFIPPPIIQVQTPPPAPPVIAVTTAAPPPPAAAPPSPSPSPARAPAATAVSVVCPNIGNVANKLADQFQSISDDDGISNARVVVAFTVGANGTVSGASVISSDSADVNALALQGVGMLKCMGQGQAVQVSAPFDFNAN